MKYLMQKILIILVLCASNNSTWGSQSELDGWIKQLKSDSPATKAYAAYMIGEYQGDRTKAIPALIETTKYLRFDDFIPPDSIKAYVGSGNTTGTAPAIEAREALVKIGEPAVEYLLEALGSSHSSIVYNAIFALGKIQDRRAMEPLAEFMLNKEREWINRYQAAESLAQFGDTTYIDNILAIEDIPRTMLKAAIPNALSYYQCDRSRKLLISYLLNEHWFVRKQAAIALRNNIHPAAYLPLFEAILSRQEDSRVRSEAVRALAAANDSVSTVYLLKGLYTSDSQARMLITQVLGDREVNVSFDPLIDLLYDEDYGVKMEAAWSLGKLGDKRATKYLEAKVLENDYGISGHAAMAIAALRDTTAIEVLIHSLIILEHPDSEVVGNALHLLTGQEYGNDFAEWIAWFNSYKDSLRSVR